MIICKQYSKIKYTKAGAIIAKYKNDSRITFWTHTIVH